MRITADIRISAPPEAVWSVVSDPFAYLHFMAGMTRWEVTGDPLHGVGARYRTLMRVGSAEVGGMIEVVEWQPDRDLAWTSVTGIDQRGRWRIRERDGGRRSHVELRLSYGLVGAGISGWVAEQVAAPSVRRNLRRTLVALKRQVEHERQRAEAAARREARAA